MRTPLVTLTTDYGLRDGYVAAVKGVVLGVAPGTTLVDVTHQIGPGDIRHGAIVLASVWSWFPPGTVHMAVVDPGVGTNRRIIVARHADRVFVGPDNGLITLVDRRWPREAMRVLENPTWRLDSVSATFHGRDFVAPAAARLALGAAIEESGPPCDVPTLLPIPEPVLESDGQIRGAVLHVDHFGNLITNVVVDGFLPAARGREHRAAVLVGGKRIGPLRRTFGDVPPGDAVAYVGSGGFLEIAINGGRAVEQFGPDPLVHVTFRT